MPSGVVTIVSIAVPAIATVIAIITVIILVQQTKLYRTALQAQTFVTLVNTARDIEFSQGMDIIRQLKYDNYDTYRAGESNENQTSVRRVIDFLNDLMHMMKHDYLTEKHVVDIYGASILACSKHLGIWRVDGFRVDNHNPRYYGSFDRLCDLVDPDHKKLRQQTNDGNKLPPHHT